MKLLIIILASISILFLVSCEKKAKLSVNPESLEFTYTNITKQLTIINDGDKFLEWSFAQMPEWLEPTRTDGKLPGNTDVTFPIIANSYFNQGNYVSEILVSTNEGNQRIPVKYDLFHEYSIQTGYGIDEIDLTYKYKFMLQKLGVPDYSDTIHNNNGSIFHIIAYENKGIATYFLNYSDEVLEDDYILMIAVLYPYRGVTANNISIGREYEDMITAYGEPEYIYPDNNGGFLLSYPTKGVDFSTYNKIIGIIWIYSPYNPELKQDNVELNRIDMAKRMSQFLEN